MTKAFRVLACCLLVFAGCKNLEKQPDYSKSAADSIALLISLVQDNLFKKLEVKITNRHNGIYQLNSIIEVSGSAVHVSTQINDMTSMASDTTFSFSREEFIEKLTQKLNDAETELVFAGNYQNIWVITSEGSSEFHTRKAYGLMALLRGDK